MTALHSPFLVAAGTCSFLAALIHLACIAGGPSWYRFFGAGEQMSYLAMRGHWHPTFMACAIATLLASWGLYAFSAAGLIRSLPMLNITLSGITAVYIARGLFGFLLQPYFPGNSLAFWCWSSGICLGIGALHLAGVRQAWPRL